MILSNFHSHTHFSDGSDDPEKYVLAALEAGMTQYGFSDHAPLPFECKWVMQEGALEQSIPVFQALRKKYEGQIELFFAMEIDYIPGRIGPSNFWHLREQGLLHYCVGSVHFVDQFADGSPWPYERTGAKFQRGLDEIFEGDIQKCVERYFELYRWMMLYDRPDIIGHFDKIKIHNKTQEYFKESDPWYVNAVHQVLEQAKKSNCIIEINTRGKCKGLVDDFYPSDWILHEINKREIPITVSSDGHQPTEVNYDFDNVEKLLRSIGFTSYMLRKNGAWAPQSL